MIIRLQAEKDCQAIYSLYQSEKWLLQRKDISIFNKSVRITWCLKIPENPWLCPLSDG